MKKNILILTGDNLGISNNQIEWKNIEILKYPVIINDREFRESDEYTAQYLIDRFKKRKCICSFTSTCQRRHDRGHRS